ncbi:MAG: UDP-N-acetylglucosamine--N-acetylmuramyl-(pentapeptide) pyrophosphoryl-undecaprenol N-acetylglucosamine transferase [Acidimicrobiia bacterium]|nr:UDP-N-acetylglucosamine--N-acetylmuramyl-(pentapeptide) pyrophosphoryl-undecaprenol N-acetylglucosamine transferase [Acidimicrobiia bacterium]
MTYALAAAGTGGHVYPALAVAEALEDAGVEKSSILFFGGGRFEKAAVPAAGYAFIELDLRGLKRSFSAANLSLPLVVARAARRVQGVVQARGVQVLLATGGYVTVPAGWGSRRAGIPFFVQEQNAHAGLANRIMSRWAEAAFTSFEQTAGIDNAIFLGNPLRREFTTFDRSNQRPAAFDYYGLSAGVPTLGVVGGSLGAGVLNEAVVDLVRSWTGGPLQIVHLAGRGHARDLATGQAGSGANPRGIVWRVVPFEDHMTMFFAAADLILARSGGMVAEITATGSPSILVPGGFGSKGHQDASAGMLSRAGAAVVLPEPDIAGLPGMVQRLLADPQRLAAMGLRAESVGRPASASAIASRLVAAHG